MPGGPTITPPLLPEFLAELDAFVVEHAPLLESDPDGFYDRLRGFVAYLVCRSIREGRSVIWREPGRN